MSAPRTLGPYRILRELGRGGQGVVWEAEDPRTGRSVAIKQLLSADTELLLRFRREGELLARLRQPGLVRVHLLLEDAPAGPALVMERVDGRALGPADVLRLGPSGAARVVAKLAGTIDALHRAGVVHRDLKPENVVLERGDEPVLIDLGLATASDVASLTRSGTSLGTPGFMSPEQARSETLDERTDVFGLGAILYFLLTARPPNGEGPLVATLERAAAGQVDEAPLAGLDPRLVAIVRRALEPNPAHRPSAAALADSLERWQHAPSLPPSPPAPPSGPLRPLVAAGAMVLCAGAALWLLASWALALSGSEPSDPSPALTPGPEPEDEGFSAESPSSPAPLEPPAPPDPAEPPADASGPALRAWPERLGSALYSRLSWSEEKVGDAPDRVAWTLRLRERLKENDRRLARIDLRILGLEATLDHHTLGRTVYPGPKEGILSPARAALHTILPRWVDLRSGALVRLEGTRALERRIIDAIPLRDESAAATIELLAMALERRLPDCLELVHHLCPAPGPLPESWEVVSLDRRGRVWYERRFDRRSPQRVTFALTSRPAGRYPLPPLMTGWPKEGPEDLTLRGTVTLGPRGVERVEATQELRRGQHVRRMSVSWEWERDAERPAATPPGTDSGSPEED